MKRLLYLFIITLLISCGLNNESNQTEISEEVQGQLKTAESLKLLMDEKKYSEAILLFSKDQQKSIEKIKSDTGIFKQ